MCSVQLWGQALAAVAPQRFQLRGVSASRDAGRSRHRRRRPVSRCTPRHTAHRIHRQRCGDPPPARPCICKPVSAFDTFSAGSALCGLCVGFGIHTSSPTPPTRSRAPRHTAHRQGCGDRKGVVTFHLQACKRSQTQRGAGTPTLANPTCVLTSTPLHSAICSRCCLLNAATHHLMHHLLWETLAATHLMLPRRPS